MAEFQEVMEHKQRMCDFYTDEYGDKQYKQCSFCSMSSTNNALHEYCPNMLTKYPKESEKIIMNWAKKHPVKTNANKFEEVFGKEAFGKAYSHTQACDAYWWSEEYKEKSK